VLQHGAKYSSMQSIVASLRMSAFTAGNANGEFLCCVICSCHAVIVLLVLLTSLSAHTLMLRHHGAGTYTAAAFRVATHALFMLHSLM
jgi:hypothetical protein